MLDQDKKPEEQPENAKPVLDEQTHSLLDELDDPIGDEATPQDEAAASLLASLDEIKPQTVPPSQPDEPVDVTDQETPLDEQTQSLLDELDDPLDDADEPQLKTDSPAETPPSITYRYRVAIALPHRLQQEITSALEAVELETPICFFQWQADFQTDDINSVQAALQQWAEEYLPIQTQNQAVYSGVVGRQTYIAGWRLSNQDLIHHAQQALTTALSTYINPDPSSRATFHGILPVSLDVPAGKFPQLVAYLQREFEIQEWAIATAQLLRAPVDSNGNWETTQEFR